MELREIASAGTMESSDIQITLEPRTSGGIEIDLTSSVMNQFGKQIYRLIRQTLEEMGVENAYVNAVDKGALDCTIKARVGAAVYRSAQSEDYTWRTKACLKRND